MPRSSNAIWIHAFWSTKDQLPLISPASADEVYHLLAKELKALGCVVQIINGQDDHVHCLFKINAQKSVCEIIKFAKGSSSHSINELNLINQKFAWQKGFGSYSVSETQLDSEIVYIKNQHKEHESKTFKIEWQQLTALPPADEN
jgi:REP element-mobilizing transposase RayT